MDNTSARRRRRITGSLCALVVAAGFATSNAAQAATYTDSAATIKVSLSDPFGPIVQPCAWRTN